MTKALLNNNTGSLFTSNISATFPSTRYQGSKAKIVDWIWNNIKHLDFHSCLDVFGGTGVVAYHLKTKGKQIAYNDKLYFNYLFGKALVENDSITISEDECRIVQLEKQGIIYPSLIQETFKDIYFTDEENKWLDTTITNIHNVTCEYKRALLFFALAQACIVKRPYNLFHRKNLYVRFADVKRSFGNKSSWDRSFSLWFDKFINEVNNAVFQGEHTCTAYNFDALDVPGEYDLVYIDTPYISRKGAAVDYADFYHFLEGMCEYNNWYKMIDWKSKHRRLIRKDNRWVDKKSIHKAFEDVFERYSSSTIVVSYRSDGIPSLDELIGILKKYKNDVSVELYGKYKYVLSKNKKSQEVLLIGK